MICFYEAFFLFDLNFVLGGTVSEVGCVLIDLCPFGHLVTGKEMLDPLNSGNSSQNPEVKVEFC